MPNRHTHLGVGVGTGALAAGYRARTEPIRHLVAELVGGAIGGGVGGVTPDILEPATSPNHRDVAHSVAAGAVIVWMGVANWQAYCRNRACLSDQLACRTEIHPDVRASAELRAVLWRMLAGAIVGFAAGYLSHLALDATTAKRIPLLMR